VALYEDLPTKEYVEGQHLDFRFSFKVGGADWRIRWYPAGIEHGKEGFCSFQLRRTNVSYPHKEISIHCSYSFMKDKKIILQEDKAFATFTDEANKNIFDIMKIDLLKDGVFSLKVTVSVPKYSFQETRILSLKKIVASLKKDIILVSGEKSYKASAAVLSILSPVFKAKLSSSHQWLDSQEKSFDLGKDFETYLTDLVGFLEGDEIDLNVGDKSHFDKFKALVTLGDMYKIDNLLEYILLEITSNPSKSDILNRLILIKSFKHIKKFNDKAKSLTLWAYKNMSQEDFMELTSTIFWPDAEL